MPRPSTLPTTLAPALAALALALAACGDEVTDPDALVASAEAEAILRSAESLPLLPSFMDDVEPGDVRAEASLLRARELWDAGTAVADERSDARRRLAVGYAAPVLQDAIPRARWIEARGEVDAWMATAGAMLEHLSLPAVRKRLDAAERLLQRSEAARSERTRIYYLLLAGSELVETTPGHVARAMAADAHAAVARAEAAGELDDRTLRRAARLKDWAAMAVSEGEYLLAIQRAYYALQLVEAP